MADRKAFLDELRDSGCKAVIYVEYVPVTEENGLNIRFCISDPGIAAEPDTEYIASYLFQ